MLKNKFKLIALLTIIILAITIPVVKATESTPIEPRVTEEETSANISEGR